MCEQAALLRLLLLTADYFMTSQVEIRLVPLSLLSQDGLLVSMKLLTYSQRLASTLVNHANHLRQKMKNQGGRRRQSILSQNWTLKIPAYGGSHKEMAMLTVTDTK